MRLSVFDEPLLNKLLHLPFFLGTFGRGEGGHMLTWHKSHAERMQLIKLGAAAMRAGALANSLAWDGEESSVTASYRLSEVLTGACWHDVLALQNVPWHPSQLMTILTPEVLGAGPMSSGAHVGRFDLSETQFDASGEQSDEGTEVGSACGCDDMHVYAVEGLNDLVNEALQDPTVSATLMGEEVKRSTRNRGREDAAAIDRRNEVDGKRSRKGTEKGKEKVRCDTRCHTCHTCALKTRNV